MMSSSDLFVEGFPHGTPEGFDRGCRGGVCPAGIEHGLSCKVAKQKSRGDYQYQKLVKSGASLASIAYALGLVGSEPGAPKPKPTNKAAQKTPVTLDVEEVPPTVEVQAKPTPTTVKGGRALAAKPAPAPALVVTSEVETPSTYQTTPDAAQGATSTLVSTAPEAPATDQPAPAEAQPEPEPEAAVAVQPERTATPKEIRAWARERGYTVSDRGTIKQAIIDHFWDATGRLDPAAKTTAPAPEAEEPGVAVVEISIDFPEAPTAPKTPRPDWGAIAEAADVELARHWAVRLEQELALVTEHLEHANEQLANAFRELETIAKRYLDTVDELQQLSERLSHRTAERDSANERACIAERAAAFTLTKWGQERAANETSHALILGQAHTINQLSDSLVTPKWIRAFDGTWVEDLGTVQRRVSTTAADDVEEPVPVPADEARERALSIWTEIGRRLGHPPQQDQP